MTDPLLRLDCIHCSYDSHPVIQGISFSLQQGDIACLLGPSGCGKTTTLRAIAGLEPLTRGEIHINGQLASQPGKTLPAEKRHLGMVFQEHALFPHLSIAANVAFALRQLSSRERRNRVRECLDMVRLQGLEDRYPHELSGGQQQRVALARALAPRPRLILLDEPFASLDLDLRRQLNRELATILRQENITTLMVTHDQEEAFAMATHVGIMQDGFMMQWDSPYRIYHAPLSRFVAEFAGAGAFLRGTVIDEYRVQTIAGELRGHNTIALAAGSHVDVLLRPEDIVPDQEGPLETQVMERTFTGPNILYRLALKDSGVILTCLCGSHLDVPIGEKLQVRIAAKHLVIFPAG